MSTAHAATGADSSRWSARRIVTDVLLGITTVLTIVAIIAIWANRQMLNADNWSATSTQLLQNQAVRTTTATFLVDQLYAKVDVASKIDSALPPRLKPLSAPIAGALRNAVVSATELALSQPLVQNAWRTANRAADQAFITIVNGGGSRVSVNGGEVTLNLGTILDQVAAELGINANLGAKLPPNAANLVILKSNQLKLVQDIGRALKGLAVVLEILVPLLYIATLLLATGRRRRTLMAIGVSGLVAGLVVILFRSIMVSAVPNSLVKDASVRPAAKAVVSIATSMLTQIAGAVILIAVVAVVCAWFAGPSRFATPARRWLAPFLAREPVAVYAVVAAVMLLIFIWQPIPATGKPIGMIVFAVLAAVGTEALRRQTAFEFPDPTDPPSISADAGRDASADDSA